MAVDLSAGKVCDKDMEQAISTLRKSLKRQFSAAASLHLNAVVTIALDTDEGYTPVMSFDIQNMSLDLLDQPVDKPDLTLIVDSLETFQKIITGQQHLVSAFMHGKFRSDGYLVLVFQVLSVFPKNV